MKNKARSDKFTKFNVKLYRRKNVDYIIYLTLNLVTDKLIHFCYLSSDNDKS